MNTVPNEIEICFSFALIERSNSIKHRRPQLFQMKQDQKFFDQHFKILTRVKPIISVKMTKIITYKNSDIDNSEIEEIGYPKPIKTIEVLSNVLVSIFVLPSNGFPRIKVKTIPVIKL